MTNNEFFIRVLHALQDYDEAMVLGLLIAYRADDSPVRLSNRSLAEVHLGGMLSKLQVQRAVARLVKRGLLRTRVYPKTWTEYTVPPESLAELLAEPLPDVSTIPGISDQPIPFLVRLQAASIVDAAQAGASLPPSSENVK